MKKKHIFTKEFDERRIDNLFQITAYAILAFAALKRIGALKVPYLSLIHISEPTRPY